MKVFKKILIYSIIIILIIALLMLIFEFFYDTHKKYRYQNIINICAVNYNIEESLILAVIKAESNFDERAQSNKGAMGLMQIKRETFLFVSGKFGLNYSYDDIFNAEKNIRAGVCYLRYLLDKFPSEEAALCAYNAGEGNVIKWLADSKYSDDGITLKKIPFKETDNYVRKIIFYKKVFGLI